MDCVRKGKQARRDHKDDGSALLGLLVRDLLFRISALCARRHRHDSPRSSLQLQLFHEKHNRRNRALALHMGTHTGRLFLCHQCLLQQVAHRCRRRISLCDRRHIPHRRIAQQLLCKSQHLPRCHLCAVGDPHMRTMARSIGIRARRLSRRRRALVLRSQPAADPHGRGLPLSLCGVDHPHAALLLPRCRLGLRGRIWCQEAPALLFAEELLDKGPNRCGRGACRARRRGRARGCGCRAHSRDRQCGTCHAHPRSPQGVSCARRQPGKSRRAPSGARHGSGRVHGLPWAERRRKEHNDQCGLWAHSSVVGHGDCVWVRHPHPH
eukprot:comp20495_c0_seq1/m.41382 comp20495_c0_seq1/g.41382  ORF comp20495_c0_seq1/g.41382 comp20495_c0_seq1/m.41382 type:complete len:323 (-) comp20495_c0_seq1:212-1180(-)